MRPLSLILIPDGPAVQPKLQLASTRLSTFQGMNIAAVPILFDAGYKDHTLLYGSIVALSPTPSIHGFLFDTATGLGTHLGATALQPGSCPG